MFFAPVIVGALLLLAGRAFIRPDGPLEHRDTGFDIGGALGITSAMVALIYGVVAVGEARNTTAGIIAFAFAAVLLTLRLDASWGYLDLFPSLLLVGVAFSLVYGPLAAAATEGLAKVRARSRRRRGLHLLAARCGAWSLCCDDRLCRLRPCDC